MKMIYDFALSSLIELLFKDMSALYTKDDPSLRYRKFGRTGAGQRRNTEMFHARTCTVLLTINCL